MTGGVWYRVKMEGEVMVDTACDWRAGARQAFSLIVHVETTRFKRQKLMISLDA
jgi:hypothetical protein